MTAVLALIRARCRRLPAGTVLTAVGVAVAVAALVVALAVRTLAGDLALRAAVGDLPAGDQSVVVSQYSPRGARDLDASARTVLAGVGVAPVRRQLLFSEMADRAGDAFRVAAVDDRGVLRLVSGRLPAGCRAGVCEVAVVGAKEPKPDPTLRLVVVGHAAITDASVLAGPFDPGRGVPVLVALGVSALDAHEPLALFQRSRGWVAPIDRASLRVAGLGELRRRLAASATVAEGQGLALTAPDAALERAARRARSSSGQLLLVGGQLVAVLAAFVALAALGMRDGHAAARRLLARRGAGRARLRAFTAIEASVPVLVGLPFGLAAGTVTAAAIARSEGAPRDRLLADIAERSSLVSLVVLVAGLAALVACVLAGGAADPGRRGLRWYDVVAGVLAGAALLAGSRGAASAGALADRSDPLIALLPGLVAGAVAFGSMRLVGPALAAAARIVPPSWPLARVGIADALRRPARPLAAVAFAVAAIALAWFAVSYRSTLRDGADDQASFVAPLDVRLEVGPSLALPLDLAPIDRYRALVPGGIATPVVRRSGVVRTTGTAPDPIEILGLDPAAIGRFGRYRADLAGGDPARLVPALGRATAPVVGATIPASARSLRLVASGTEGLEVDAVVARPDGVQFRLALPGTLPPAARGGTLVGVVVQQTTSSLSGTLHHLGEGGGDVAVVAADVRLEGIVAEPGGSLPLDLARWVAVRGETAFVGGRLVVRGGLQGSTAYVRAPQPLDGVALPVIVDPATAAATGASGLLDLDVAGEATLRGRVVAVARRFPTLGQRFVVAAGQPLQRALDAAEPGTGTPGEVWLGGARVADAVRGAPFDRLARRERAVEEARRRDDPLARAAAALLGLAALAAAALAAVAAAIVVRADIADGGDDLLALEADGVAPPALRRLVAVRATALLALALGPGVFGGVVLTRAVAALVAVTATGETPDPPLLAGASPTLALTAALVVLSLALAAAFVAAATALREPVAPRPAGGGP